MSILKKALTTAAIATALIATSAQAETKRIALVVKALGIGFFEAAAKGAEEAAKELGDVEVIYTGPTDTTAEGQIEVINALIAQKVDAIAVSANDTDALVPVLQKAMDRGITVISWDSGVAPAGRAMHLNPSSSPLIGNTILKLAADHLPEGGDVAILFDNLYPSLPQTEDGKLVALAVTTPERSFKAPNIPTMRESAPELANFDVSSWFGMFIQAGTPRPIVDAYNAEIKKMLERDDIKKNIAAMGAVPDYGTPEQYSAFIDAEIKKFAGIINKEGLKMDVN